MTNRYFANDQHEEVAELESRLSDLYSGAIGISNWLFERSPDNPMLDEVSALVSYIENVDFESPYAEAKTAAGESWWDEPADTA